MNRLSWMGSPPPRAPSREGSSPSPTTSVLLLLLSNSEPQTSTSTKGQTMLRPFLGRCRAPRIWGEDSPFGQTPAAGTGWPAGPAPARPPCLQLDGDGLHDLQAALVEGVEEVVPHDVRLQDVAAAPAQHEQRLVQLHRLVWKQNPPELRARPVGPGGAGRQARATSHREPRGAAEPRKWASGRPEEGNGQKWVLGRCSRGTWFPELGAQGGGGR